MRRLEGTPRLLVAGALLSGWMVLIFSGVILGGAVHLLLVAALAVFPWRPARSPEG